jgi:fimbrial chaperone protein
MLWNNPQKMAVAQALAAIFFVLPLACPVTEAQALSVTPVNVFLSPGQRATTLTVSNTAEKEISTQIRAYAWNQKDGEDQLTASETVVASPPLATIAPGSSQVIRLLLRQPPAGRECTYRILVDQIPPPVVPGVVSMVLRLSIPVFAQPATRAVAHLQFHLERDSAKVYLVGRNDGLRHEVIRDIVLITSDGRKLKEETGASPYILAGATRRWPIAAQGPLPLPSETLHLTAHAEAGSINQQVQVVAAP